MNFPLHAFPLVENEKSASPMENLKMTAKVTVENEFSTTLHFSFGGKSEDDYSIAKNSKSASPWWKNEL